MNLFLCIFISASRALKESRGISLSNARRALQPHFTRFAFDLNKTLNQPFPSIFVGHDEQHEIQRQNRITEQILTNFFERKFFPNRKPKPAPTIDEILPPESRANPSIRDKHSAHKDDDDETDNLQSVESEQIDSFYRDYSEGRWKFANFLGDRWLCPCFMCFFILPMVIDTQKRLYIPNTRAQIVAQYLLHTSSENWSSSDFFVGFANIYNANLDRQLSFINLKMQTKSTSRLMEVAFR